MARLALFAAALALIFAASALAGSAIGPEPKSDPEPTHGAGAEHGEATQFGEVQTVAFTQEVG